MTHVAEAKNRIDELVLEGWEGYWDNPVHFVTDVLGVKPEPYQADILDAIAEYDRVAVKSGHGPGKTATAAWADIWFLGTRPFSKVPITAPTFEKQVRDIFWAEVHKWVRESPMAKEVELTQTRMAVKGHEEEWFSVGLSASKPENLEGFHAPHILYIVDEAKGVPDDIFDGIQGSLTTEAKLLLISTPGASVGYFSQVFSKFRRNWKTFSIPCVGRWEKGKAIRSSQPISPLISIKWIEARKEEWGEDSPIYQARVMAEFPSEGEDTLIPLAHIEAAERREVDKTSTPLRRALGVDVARHGSDLTVYTCIEAHPSSEEDDGDPDGLLMAKLTFVRRRKKKSVVEVAAEAKLLARELDVDVVVVDDTGVGGGVTDILQAEGINTEPVLFGSSPSEGDSFINLKAELFWGVRRAFETGHVSLSPREGRAPKQEVDVLVAQLSSMKYEIKPKGIRIVDPDEAGRSKKSPIQGPKKSPDHAHSFGLAWWAAAKHVSYLTVTVGGEEEEGGREAEEGKPGRLFDHVCRRLFGSR